MDTFLGPGEERTLHPICSTGLLAENSATVHIRLYNPFVLRSNAMSLQDGTNTRTHQSKNVKIKETSETGAKTNADNPRSFCNPEYKITAAKPCDIERLCIFPANVVINVMEFLDTTSLLHFRAVCRLFNTLFCFPRVFQRFASLFMRAAMGTTLEVDTVNDIMYKRVIALQHRERVYTYWMMNYIGERVGKSKEGNATGSMRVFGTALRVQQQNAYEFCRRAVEEWLGHQADCRRVRYNISHNWFNVTSLSCRLGFGIPPVLLPDGTLCINDPPTTILFFARRERKKRCCFARSTKARVPSRAAEAIRDLWFCFGKITLSSEVTLMHYDPYINGLHVGLENSETTILRVRGSLVTGLEQRLGERPKMAPPLRKERTLRTAKSAKNEGIEFLSRYSTIADSGFATFIQLNQDAVGVPDYEWSEEEIWTLCLAHGGSENTTCPIIVKQERNVTELSSIVVKGRRVTLMKKDITQLMLLQRKMAQQYGAVENGEGIGLNNEDLLHMPHNCFLDQIEIYNNHGNNSPSAGEPVTYSSEATAVQLASTEESKTVNYEGVNCYGSQQFRERYVFGVFNEQTTLSCAVAYTREVAVFALSLYNCKFLGACSAGDTRRVHILKAPVFQPCESNTDEIINKGDLLIACEEAGSILICQQTIFRKVKFMKTFIDTNKSDSNTNGVSTNSGIDSNSLNTVDYRTWYFLKGYYYEAYSNELKVLMEITSPALADFVNPRPWSYSYKHATFKGLGITNSDSTTNVEKEELEKEKLLLFSSWCPLRDGHPYFREPFMLYITRNAPYIAFPRKSTASEQRDFCLEEQRFFHEASILEGTRQSSLRVSSIALSPVHAFFLLGMDNGAILLVSPFCAESSFDVADCKTDNMVAERVALSSDRQQTASVQLFRRRRAFVPQRVTTLLRTIDDEDDDYDQGTNESSDEEETAAREVSSLSQTPISHLYRFVPINSESNARQRLGRRNHICLFSAVQMFGDGFFEDKYISSLQSMTSSVLTATTFEGSEGGNMPLHAVWVFLPPENFDSTKLAAVWSMHVDEWKLTTLSTLFEIAIYNLSPQTTNGNCVVFQQLLTISPYKHYPYTAVFASNKGSFLCSKIRRILQRETKRQPTGSEIMWQNGALVIYSATGGNRYTIFDFNGVFCDPDAVNKNKDATVAYSAKLKEYRRTTPGVTLLIGRDSFKGDGTTEKRSTTITFSRHFPVLLQRHFLKLLSIILRPIVLFFAFVALMIMMFSLDQYINASLWVALAFYAPFAFGTIFHDYVLYDRYYEDGCGVLYFIALLSRFFLFVLFPILFTAKHELYKQFHPPWVLLTVSLDIGIFLASIPSLLSLFKARYASSCLMFLRLVNYFAYFLCIAFVLLISIYFDGPSLTDPKKPKFHLVIAFIPIFLLIISMAAKVCSHYITIHRRLCLVYSLCIMFIFAAPIALFIGQFNYYWDSVAGNGTKRRPSLIQTCFFLPLLLLGKVFYFAVLAFVLLKD